MEMEKFKEYFIRQWYSMITEIVTSANDEHRTTDSLEG